MRPIPTSLILSLILALILENPSFVSAAHAQTDLPVLSNPRLSLTEALNMAAENSVKLQQVRADAEAASAAARGAQAQTRPSLSATTYATVGNSANIMTSSPGIAPQNILNVAPHSFADQNLMLMVPLLTGGQLKNNATAAHKLNEAAAASVLASRLTVAEAVTEGYTDAALQQSLLTVAQTRLTAETEQVRVTQEKITTGRSARLDLLREQAELADASQAVLAAQNSAALALMNLKTVLGISLASQITPSDTLDVLSGVGAVLPATLRDALSQADTQRPELAAAQRQIEAAQSALNAAKGAGVPQVYGVAMADATAGQSLGRIGYTVGLTASLPLYDGGQRRSDVDGAQARLNRARADAQGIRQQVDQDTVTAWLNMQTSAAQVQSVRVGVIAAQQGYDLADLRYNAGKSVTAERLDALAAWVRAQGGLAQAQANLIIGRARLCAAIGGSANLRL